LTDYKIVLAAIKPRCVLVVDEEKGLTFGVYMFQHKGLTQITMKDGSTRPEPYFVGQSVTMPMAEVFKIVNGKIREVEAIGVQIPYGLGPGWE
jgi:mannose-6-phosphate isomerase-like protein (cupin superfamily)